MTNLAEELKNIITNGAVKYPIPFKKGNSIFIGNVVIRPTKQVYLLIDTKTGEQICTTHTKYGALAAAKVYLQNQDLTKVLFNDITYNKNNIDIMFYNHTLEVSNDQFKKDIVLVRKQVAENQRNLAQDYLEQIIFKRDK